MQQNASIRGIVINNQHSSICDSIHAFVNSGATTGLNLKFCGKLKCAALIDDTCAENFTVHQFHKASGNGQPQTGSAEATRRRCVGLMKRLEDFIQLLGWNANSRVSDSKIQHLLIADSCLGID